MEITTNANIYDDESDNDDKNSFGGESEQEHEGYSLI